nr:hypothetical protein [Frankia canadensis]
MHREGGSSPAEVSQGERPPAPAEPEVHRGRT